MADRHDPFFGRRSVRPLDLNIHFDRLQSNLIAISIVISSVWGYAFARSALARLKDAFDTDDDPFLVMGRERWESNPNIAGALASLVVSLFIPVSLTALGLAWSSNVAAWLCFSWGAASLAMGIFNSHFRSAIAWTMVFIIAILALNYALLLFPSV